LSFDLGAETGSFADSFPTTTTTTERSGGVVAVVPSGLLLVVRVPPQWRTLRASATAWRLESEGRETAAPRVVVRVGQVALSRMLRRGGAKP